MIGATAKQLTVDLIVMGSVGRSGLTGLLIGNTAEKTLHASEHSVLIVKPDGFTPPSFLVGARQTRTANQESASAEHTLLSGSH